MLQTKAPRPTHRTSTVHPSRLWMSYFAWAIAVLLWVLLKGSGSQPIEQEVVGISVTLLTLGWWGAAAMDVKGEGLRTALGRLRMGPWMAVGFALGFGGATLVWLGEVPVYRGLVGGRDLGYAALIAGAGFLALIFGYRKAPVVVRRSVARMDQVLRGRAPFSTGAPSVWALWFIAVGAQAIQLASGSLGYLSDPSATSTSSLGAALSTLASVGLVATLAAAWRLSARPGPGSFALLAWVATSQVSLGLFSGLKESAVIHLVALVVGYSSRSRLRLVPLVATGFIAVFFVTPFVTAYRAAIVSGSGRLSPAQVVADIDFGTLVGSESNESRATDHSEDRWSRIGDVAIISAKTPETIPYEPAVRLVAGPFLGFIPRSLWPEKPVLDAGYQVSVQYYEIPAHIYTSSALTPYGDLYRHGGILMVISGMGLLGSLVRSIDDRPGRTVRQDPRLLFLPMLMFPILVKQEMDFIGLTAALPGILVAAALSSRLCGSMRRPTTEASSTENADSSE